MTEDKFEALAQQVSKDAANIDCSSEEYREGLITIIEVLQSDRQASSEMDETGEQ